MSKLEQITAFIQVVEENGFAAAAKKLQVSTAAISRQVTTLEATLGVQLLTRTTRQIALTEIGLQYYQHCKTILAELNEAENAIAGSRHEATGILTITSNRYFGMSHLLPRLHTFMAANPKLRVKLDIAERFPDLAQEGIDILFGVTVDGPPELIRRRIITTQYRLCASPAYLKKFGTPQIPTDLTRHHYITHSMRKPVDVLTFKDNKEIYLEPTLWLNDTRAMRECAIQGMGIIKLHDYEVDDAIKAGQLLEVLPEWRGPRLSVYLYYQQSRYLSPKIRRFIDFYLT